MASAAAAAPVSGQVVQRFRARLREEAGEEPGPAAVVGVYEEALAELTFNCKPIITELTIIAEQHAPLAARGIADVICARIVEVPVEQKLPSLYLLDSIVKNIGREYIAHFSTRLQKVFCYAYREAHPNQHASMRHLFRTWSQVFPSAVLRGIEDELQFSPSEIKRPATTNNVRQSESLSPSPRPSHGIHVNPKYLEAQHQFKHVSKVDQLVTHDRQMTDVEEDHINGLTSNGLRGFPATSSKLQKSTILYADDPDQQEAFLSRAGMTRRDLSRSPPLDVLPRNASPKRPLERPPLSHSLLGHDPRRLPDRNGWFERQWAFDDGPQRPSMNMLDEEYRKRSARELIDAYGGNDADERLSKMQRLESNGMSSRSSAQSWLTSEEEEYSWEDMSPTLSSRNRNGMLLPSSETLRAGFPGPNSGQLDSDIGMRSWHSQAPRSAADRQVSVPDDRTSAPSHVDMATRRYAGNFGPQNGAASQYHSAENPLDLGRILAMSAPPWQQTNSLPLRAQEHQPSLNRLPLPTDGEMPVKRLVPGGTYDSMNVDIPFIDNHRSSPAPAPIEWPLHHSQQAPDRKHIRRATDNLEIRPFISHGINSSVFVPRHQYDALDRKNVSTGNLAQLPHQHPDLLSSSQENQGTILESQSQPHKLQFNPHTHSRPLEAFRGFAPSISVDPSRNPFQGPGGSATIPSVPPLPNSFSLPPSVQPYSTSAPNFALPPVHPGLPPASLQMGPSSSQVGGPTPFFSGILSNLVHQGVITLDPPSQLQESVGVDFSVDLKVRNESVINALYQDLPRQCKTCGLRFKCQEEHRVHMDWHVTKNRNSKNRKQSSRKYFVTVGEWLRAAETVGNDGVPSFEHMEPVPDRNEEKEMAVPADEDQTACALCQEPFEDFYSDETEEWMYKGAVYMNAPDGNIVGLERSHLGPIVHAKCRSGPSYT